MIQRLRGCLPECGPEPVGAEILWRGEPRRVYRLDELVLAQVGEWMVWTCEGLRERYADMLQRWWAS